MHGSHRTEPDHPCWWCHWWGGVTAGDTAALCDHPTCCRVRAQPERGCSCFVREPGADDEPEWVPVVITEGPGVWAPSSGPPLGGTVKWAP